MTYTEVYDNGMIRAVARSDSVCLTAGQQYIYITPEELADIADAVAQHLSAAEIPCPDSGEWDPLGGGG